MNSYKNVSINDNFDYWTVISEPIYCENFKRDRYRFMCKCVCGTERVISFTSLIHKRSMSCGCKLPKSKWSGEAKTRLYHIWNGMIQRCSNINDKGYKYYGAKGISVCKEWLDFYIFKKFCLENGYLDNLSIDRIDNNKNYEPNNVKFSTKEEQNRNQTTNIKISLYGEEKCLAEWARDSRTPVRSINCVYKRISRGWDPVEAITTY